MWYIYAFLWLCHAVTYAIPIGMICIGLWGVATAKSPKQVGTFALCAAGPFLLDALNSALFYGTIYSRKAHVAALPRTHIAGSYPGKLVV